MNEYTPEVIKEMVDNFMTSYKNEVEKNGLREANQYADQYLMDLSRDMPQEAADAFVQAASKPLSAYLTQQLKDADMASQELTEEE